MEKIKELMAKAGLSPEAADGICEAIGGYLAGEESRLNEEYTRRTELAKKICIDETEQNKTEMARRVQLWCEAKNAEVERIISHQIQAREGQASSMLEQVKDLLSGIDISDDVGIKKEYLAIKEANAKLARERDMAIEKANRQTQLCERVLKRNRHLEARHVESADAGNHTVLGEGNGRQNSNKRLDGNRRGSAPAVTTRRTLAESQDRRPVHDDRNGGNVRRVGQMPNGLTPSDIAATIEDGPPL